MRHTLTTDYGIVNTLAVRMKSILSTTLIGLMAVALVAMSSVTVSAQTSPTAAGTVGAQFLKIGVGARYLGMGEAAVATPGDAFSLYWNPAALTELEGSQLAFAHTDWVLDVSLSYAAYAQRVEGLGVIAVGLTALNMPKMEQTTDENNNTQDGNGVMWDATSYAFELGFARELTPRFSFGGGVKYVYESIFTETATGVAFDFGTMLTVGLRNLRLGMNISNLGSTMRFSGPNLGTSVGGGVSDPSEPASLNVEEYEMPLTFRFGVAYDLQFNYDSRLTLAGELKHPNDNVQHGAVGMEYGFKETFFLRSGYKINYDDENLTFGGGLKTSIGGSTDLCIDYAWTNFDRLDNVHRFSLNVSL